MKRKTKIIKTVKTKARKARRTLIDRGEAIIDFALVPIYLGADFLTGNINTVKAALMMNEVKNKMEREVRKN